MNKNKNFVNSFRKFFLFDSFGAIFKKEIIGGLSTFLAMAYILAVNPAIVGDALIKPGETSNAHVYSGGLFLATAISSCVATMFMGLFAKVPVALAPGMGLNAFFAYTISYQVGFDSAMTITILSGILYFVVVMTPLREKISEIIPTNLKISIGAGIGFFVAYLGLQNSKIIDSSPSTLTKLGDFGNPLVIVAVVLLMLGLVLHYAKVTGAIIITMLIGAIILIPMVATNTVANADAINPVKVGYSGFETFPDVIKSGWKGFANKNMWTNPITYIGVLSFLYMDFFDTTGTLITIDKEIGLTEKNPKWINKANFVDAVSTIGGASIGATTVTSFVESTVGVGAGAKTGFSMIITSLCFGLSIALWPIIQIFLPIDNHQPITGPILVIVGTMMISQIRHFEWQITIDIPVLFVTIIMMMLSNSIAYGIAFGIITFIVLNAALGSIQVLFKKSKRIVNSMEIPMIQDEGIKIKTREFYYLRRINWWLVGIFVVSIAYIILQSGIDYHGWFKN